MQTAVVTVCQWESLIDNQLKKQKMIQTLNFRIFPSDEFFTFGSGVVNLVNGKLSDLPALTSRANKLNSSIVPYQQALMRESKNPYTEKLAIADKLLDASFVAFRTYVDAGCYRNVETWSTAALQLREVIRNYDWSAQSLGYKAQIAAMVNMVKAIKEHHSDLVTVINGDDWFTAYDENLEAFVALYNESSEKVATNEVTLKETRPVLTDALRKLFSRIDLLQEDEPSTAVDELVASINELIVRSLSTVKAAATREEHSKDNESVN